MMNRTNSGFMKLKGNFISNSSLLHPKTPFSCFITNYFLHSRSYLYGGRSKFQNVKKASVALKLFDRMIQKRPLPSVFEFNQLLIAVTKIKRFPSCLGIFKRMCDIGIPVDKYTMTSAIKCFSHLHRTNEGFAVLGFCFRRAIVPNVFTFSTLLNGLVMEDRILEAEILFKKLIKHNICEPDVVMYNTMIKGLCKVGNNESAIALLKLMEERGVKPDIVSYSAIIDRLCKDKLIDEAFKHFKEMIFHKGMVPDVSTYTSLISGLSNLGRSDEVVKLLKERDEVVISLDYSVLAFAFRKIGKIEEAYAVFNIMVERGKVPDIVTYSSLINGYCLRGEMNKAKTIFDSMLINGMTPNVVTYNTMIQGMFRVGRCGAAGELFNEMRAQGHMPNERTYGIILEGLCNSHTMEDALASFNLNSDIAVYNILIDAAGKCGKLDIARNIFDDLSVRGLQANVRTYTVMINCLCEEGLLGEAKQLFLKMEESGCPPNDVTYRVLLQGYLKNRHYDDVKMVLQEMDGKGYSLDGSTLRLLRDQIAAGLVDSSMVSLISKLVPKLSMAGLVDSSMVSINFLAQAE